MKDLIEISVGKNRKSFFAEENPKESMPESVTICSQ